MLSRDEFNALSRQVLDLHVRWNQYIALYSGDEVDTKMAIMNAVAPTFFFWDREAWLDGIFQAISRLMDKSLVTKKQTLGFNAIVEKLDEPLKTNLQPLMKDIILIYQRGIQQWRNKRLSHSDRDYHLGLTRLPDVPINDVKELVLKFEQLINTISLELYDETGAYFEIEVQNGAEKLLSVLKQCRNLPSTTV